MMYSFTTKVLHKISVVDIFVISYSETVTTATFYSNFFLISVIEAKMFFKFSLVCFKSVEVILVSQECTGHIEITCTCTCINTFPMTTSSSSLNIVLNITVTLSFCAATYL